MKTTRFQSSILYFAARLGVVTWFFGILAGCSGERPSVRTLAESKISSEFPAPSRKEQGDMTKITIQLGDRGFNASGK